MNEVNKLNIDENSDLNKLLNLFSLTEERIPDQDKLGNISVTLAVVLKVNLSTVEKLKQCIHASKAHIVYQKTALENLYITNFNPKGDTKQ